MEFLDQKSLNVTASKFFDAFFVLIAFLTLFHNSF